MIIAEVNAFANVLAKAGTFADYMKDGWYKSSEELRIFRVKVRALEKKHKDRLEDLRRSGLSDDSDLSAFVEEAEKILSEEQERASKLRKSKWERFKGRVFPGRLTEILGSMEEIVDTHLGLLKSKVDTNRILEQNLSFTGIPLPFRRDPNYVPIAHLIAEVQTAVENVESSRVVVVHGDGGMRKTSLVKYVALHYAEMKRAQVRGVVSQWFSDGVFFLKCGKGSSTRIKELEQELLESLGSGFETRADLELEGGYRTEPSRFHRSLRFKLARRKSLIIFDDVHESEVLERLLIPGDAVTYLITSRRRDIWPDRDVQRIPMEKPSLEDAKKILGMYTELAENIEVVVNSIIEDVDFHPLMLANIGLAMGSTGEKGPTEWRKMAKGWQDKLQRSGFKHHPVMYRELYRFSMEESMRLMMDSLEEGERSLIRLMSLLEAEGVPEVVVKFFRKAMEPEEVDLDYSSCVNQLHNKSLLEIYSPQVQGSSRSNADIGNSQRFFAIHRLRALYIRSSSSEQLQSMAVRALKPASHFSNYPPHSLMAREVTQGAITTTMRVLQSLVGWGLGSANSRGFMITGRRSRAEENNCQPAVLTGIMAAMYVDKACWDAVEPSAQSLLRASCYDLSVIPGSVHAALDVMDLVKRAREKKRCLGGLVELLNPDADEEWKQEARHCAAKIIVKFICRQELDDISVAQLVQLQDTTVIICHALLDILRDGYWALEFVDRKVTFSSAHSITFNTVLHLLRDNSTTLPIICTLMSVLRGFDHGYLLGFPLGLLDYEDEDTILNIGEALVQMFVEDTNNARQDAFIQEFFCKEVSRAAFVMGKIPDLLKRMLRLLVDRETSNQSLKGRSPLSLMETLSRMKRFPPQIFDVPDALDMLWSCIIVPKHPRDAMHAVDILTNLTRSLTGETDNVQRICANRRDVGNLLKVLAFNFEGTPSFDQVAGFELPHRVVVLLSCLCITKEIRQTILQLFPEVLERLQTFERALAKHHLEEDPSRFKFFVNPYIRSVSKAKTILTRTMVNNAMTDYDPIRIETFKCILEGKFSGLLCMEMYKEALDVSLDIHFDQNEWYIRHQIIFAKAMVEDYRGALTIANKTLLESQRERQHETSGLTYAERGVLTRLSGGSLAEAIADFDASMKIMWSMFYERPDLGYLCNIYHLLKQRGFAKHLNGDNTGARADAQSAQDLQLRNLVSENFHFYFSTPSTDLYGILYQEYEYHFDLLRLKTDYLGFVFSF